MTITERLSRRSFVRLLGIGGATAGALALGAACGDDDDTTARAQPEDSDEDDDHGASNGGGMTNDEMDAAAEAKVKAFPAATEGLGGQPLPFTMDGDTKVFDLTVDEVEWEVEPGVRKKAYGYNGVLPGPEIRVTEGDKIRVIVTNNMSASTSVHWHGQKTPNAMDGVPFLTQPPIKPGETFTYEFVASPSGTHMYHSHHDATVQVGKGLLGPLIVEPKDASSLPAFDKEYTMILNDGLLGFTLNGKSFPATQPLTAKLGETVLIRYMNEGLMAHPMHLHGLPMTVIAVDGYPLPNPYQCDTIFISPGNRYDVLVPCDAPGAWAFHCHILSHAEASDGMFGMVTVLIVEE